MQRFREMTWGLSVKPCRHKPGGKSFFREFFMNSTPGAWPGKAV
jgi:hypothetical protein